MLEELVTLASMYTKHKSIFPGRGKKLQIGGKIRSLAQATNEATYYFPVVASDNLSSDEIIMIMRALERVYAVFTRTAFSLVPAIKVDDISIANVQEYLRQFHTNIGVKTPLGITINLEATAEDKINYGVLNENNAAGRFKKKIASAMDKINVSGGGGKVSDYVSVSTEYDKSGNERRKVSHVKQPSISDTDWRKANDLIPSTVTVPVRFIQERPDGNNIEYNVEITVNIKATMHRASSEVLVNDIVKSINQGRGFLNFVKYISGEQKSLADFLFGISSMKEDLLNRKNNPWLEAFKRRKRLADLAWGTLLDSFTPIGTLCLTMNEVNILKTRHDIDVFKEAEKIIKHYYLLGFMIVDQVNEVIYVQYDSQPGFQEYPYKTLEREGSNQDRTIREMIKALGNFR